MLGLALTAALALSSATASAALAKAPEFHAEEAPVTYRGEQVEAKKFTMDGGTAECSTGSFEGVGFSTASTELELAASYAGCTAFESPATWSMNGCTYRSTMVVGSFPPTSVTDIICPVGKEITITTPGCVVHIPPQNNVKHVIWKNQGGGGPLLHITETITEEGIAYTETAGCAFPGKHTDGVALGTVTIVGENSEGEPESIWVE